ncbi:MAG: DUF523 domain-containing protein [Sinobacterium sp.]|jgi:uncharacterized protein YbbK (DUF523 family)
MVAVISCLLDDPVRYDGGHKRQNSIVEVITTKNTIISFCPEVPAQLGTPRPSVEVVVRDSHIEALGHDDSGLNVTTALNKAAAMLVTKLKAKNAVAKLPVLIITVVV